MSYQMALFLTTMVLLPKGCDVHFFVDEFVVNDGQDLNIIDDITAKIDKKNHAWITVAKASKTHRYDFEAWLEKKITEGFREPSLIYPLRNSKEIIKFESSLAPNSNIEKEESKTTSPNAQPWVPDSDLVESSEIEMVELQSNLDSLDSDSDIEEDDFLTPSLDSEVPVSTSQIQAFGLPRPMTKLKLPVNLTCGDKVCIEVHDKRNKPLVDALKLCFKKLPPHRVLIVALAEEISSDFISAIEEARNGRRPLVVDRKSQADSSSSTEVREYELFVRKWLIDLAWTQDLIASSCVIAGFEWAAVLMITNNNHESQFYARNMVMRAMSRLVWLKTNSIDEVNEQVIKPKIIAIGKPGLNNEK